MKKAKKQINVLSLFANIGVAEAYLENIGIHVAVANELIKRRADLYQKIYPQCKMICGDIFSDAVQNQIVAESQKNNVELIMATPPCQGMSTAGKQDIDDYRNTLFLPVVKIVKELDPKFVFIENVPLFLQTHISYHGQREYIIDIIKNELGNKYRIECSVANTADYGVPQTRERAIILLSRKDQKALWQLPCKDSKIVTMRDAIGDLPSLDPFVRDVSNSELLKMFPHYYEKERVALEISPWNFPPHHVKRQVEVMVHTPTGQSAFNNPDEFKPKKENGTPVHGYLNTYKRQEWDIPAYTVTMDNRKISSQNNVHPGRYMGLDENGVAVYSDARALTVYELMKIMSLPDNWPIPRTTPAAFLRSIIGEGIPPLFVKKVFENLMRQL